jgi:predicted acylesterase/phospholipase RssA
MRVFMIGTLAVAVLQAGCLAHVERLPQADPAGSASYFSQSQDPDVIVGVALSGGGSRAALFAAGGLKALALVPVGPERRSLLEQVSHLSSVSGGSLAASYFVSQKPPRATPVLGPDGALTDEYRIFFDRYQDAMGENYERPILLRQTWNFRAFNPTKAATSLSEVLDDGYLGGLTLRQLNQREARGDSPRLIINTTLYNNGRRFVITTLPREAFQYNVLQELRAALKSRGQALEFPPSLARAQAELTPWTFDDLGADPRNVPLSKAVAASASFPPLVGPVTVQVAGSDLFWHAGDGGLFDNQGAESLMQVALKKLREGTARRALILVLDSSYPFTLGGERLGRTEKGFTVFTRDPSRIVGIMEQRANAYQAMVWHILQAGGILLPDARTVTVIVLRHTDAAWHDDLGDVPAVCRREESELNSPRAVNERLAQIPTRFAIDSDCDRQLLVAAAAKVVAGQAPRILEFLEGRPGQGGAP